MAKLYISATRRDLAAECQAVKEWLLNDGHMPMDSYGPDPNPILESCLADIDGCDLFLMILGHYYGDRPAIGNPENLSYTHLEFRHALAKGIPRFVFKRTTISIPTESALFDPNEPASVKAFHEEVDANVRTARFADTTELLDKLRSVLEHQGLAPGAAAVREPFRRASRDLFAWPSTLSDGGWLDRPELGVLRQRIHSSPYSVTLVLGEPGCGKSALLARLGRDIQAQGTPVLGVKANALPEGILTPQALGQHLELPVSVVSAVQALAAKGPVLVLLDQLDALADMVVQHSARLRLLMNLIRDLAGIPNVHVVASCRPFEQRHDPSLRNLEADTLTLELPSWEAVDAVLQQHGVQAGSWNADMRETLRSPHALDIFLSLLKATDEPGLLGSFQGMLQVLWERRVLSDATGARKPLLLDLARRMADREMLWLSVALFQGRWDLVQALVADGLLLLEQGSGRIEFRHQTLYEFVRVQAFLESEGSLAETVLAGQGSLRIRPQLWHTLIYLRRVAPDEYQAELQRLWVPELRPHLRMLLIEFLGMQAGPMSTEIRLAFQNFDDSWFQGRFLNAVVGSPGWFDRLATSHLPMLMTRPDQEAAAILPILDQALAFAPQVVLTLVDSHWLPHADRDTLTWRTLAMGSVAPQDVVWVDRLEGILARTDLATWAVSHVASIVSAALPEQAPRLISTWLSFQWRKAQSEITASDEPAGEGSALELRSSPQAKRAISLLESRDLHDLPALAEAAPQAFVQAVWPIFLELLETVTGDPHPVVVGFREGTLLDYGMDEEEESRLERPLLEALSVAMDQWAKAQPSAFLDFIRAHAGRDLLLAQRLLARGLVNCASLNPALVLNFLCSDPRRLVLGPYSDHHRDTRKLIQAVAPHLNPSQLQCLEETLLHWRRYHSAPDDATQTRRDRLRWNREHRLRLLRSLPPEFMSLTTRRLMEQEERAFPDLMDRDIRFSGFREVRSPISADQMWKASDENILNLFAELTDEHDWDHPRHKSRGGAIQAGRELAKLAEIDVERAVRLVRRLQPGRNDGPASELLSSLQKAGYAADDLYALIEELSAKGFGSDSFRQAAADAVSAAVSETYPAPKSILSLLESWLVPADQASQNDSAEAQRDSSLLWGHGGVSVLPHGNFPVLAALSRVCLVAEPPLMQLWLDILERHLLRSESPRVWAALSMWHLRWLSQTNQFRAQAFLERLFLAYPSILDGVAGVRLMAYLQHWISPENARGWLGYMANVGAQGYGEVLMLRHALFPAEEWPRQRVEELLSSIDATSANQRTGIVHTVVQLWSEPGHRTLAHSYLLKILPSQETGVLQALGNIFFTQPLPPDQPTRELLDALCTYRTLLRDRHADRLVEHLEALVAAEPERVVRLCHVMLDEVGETIADLAKGWYLSGELFTAIAFELQDMGGPHRDSGLRLFERLLEFNLPHAREMTLSLDKRTPPTTNTPRPSRRRKRHRKSE